MPNNLYMAYQMIVQYALLTLGKIPPLSLYYHLSRERLDGGGFYKGELK